MPKPLDCGANSVGGVAKKERSDKDLITAIAAAHGDADKEAQESIQTFKQRVCPISKHPDCSVQTDVTDEKEDVDVVARYNKNTEKWDTIAQVNWYAFVRCVSEKAKAENEKKG